MKRCLLSFLALFPLVLPAVAFGGEAPLQTGTVKGAITIAEKPASGVVVSVEGLPLQKLHSQNARPISKHAVMEQRELKFVPYILPVLVGTTVDFPNNDKTWHNVFSASETKKFDLGLYPSGKTRSVIFDKPGVVRILCNVHHRMEAFIVVKEHPYFTLTDARGNYRLSNIPLGRYRLEVWHPALDTKTEHINLVREGEVLAMDVDLKK
jgi:plastocyanin